MQRTRSAVDEVRVAKRPPRARIEFVDTATGESVCPDPPGREESDGAAPTGRIVADFDEATVEVDPEDIISQDGEHPRTTRFVFEADGIVDYAARAHAQARQEKRGRVSAPPKRPRAFRETFDSARDAAADFFDANELFFDYIPDASEGIRDWMDGIEVRSGNRTRRLSATSAGQRILGQPHASEAIRQSLAYVFGQSRGRRWDDVDWMEVERLEESLRPYFEPPDRDASSGGIYWRPVVGRPSIDELEALPPDQREQYSQWESSEELREALEELRDEYARSRECISPKLRAIIERRIEAWEHWAADPSKIPAYACEPDPTTGGYTCDYPSVAGELRQLSGACAAGYDPDWSTPASREASAGFPDTSRGPDDPRLAHETASSAEPPAAVWDGFDEVDPGLFGSAPSAETLESLRQLADDGRAYGGPQLGVLERREADGVLYQLELRTCGKRNPETGTPWCWCMTDFPERGHGPYWYAYWRGPENGRRRSRYIGKILRPIAELPASTLLIEAT